MPSHPLMESPTRAPHYFSREGTPFSASEIERMRPFPVSFEGVGLQFLTGNGLFSRGEFDEGSRLLVETLHRQGQFPDAARFCDLGCGWGGIGALWGATHPGHFVFACDVNPRAAQLTGVNFARNAVDNAAVWCADGLSATRDEVFDVVACNPPIRAGNATIESLFESAHRCLKAKG